LNTRLKTVNHPVHRLIPSRYPPVSLFDWAESEEELRQIAALEGLTNDRLQCEYGLLSLVSAHDWVSGEGSTPLMAAFTHPGPSRFTDGSYGIYYAGESLHTAIAETKFHRERFLRASAEKACLIQMREYRARVKQPLIDISFGHSADLLNPDIACYPQTQAFGFQIKTEGAWGIYYPSVRRAGGYCVAIMRPPALTIPVQASHLEYIWDGETISDIRQCTTVLA